MASTRQMIVPAIALLTTVAGALGGVIPSRSAGGTTDTNCGGHCSHIAKPSCSRFYIACCCPTAAGGYTCTCVYITDCVDPCTTED